MNVVLNPAAHGGRGRELWSRVESRVGGRVLETDPDGRWRATLHRAIEGGDRAFIAAGGDGTVNAVLNAIVESGVPTEDFTLGAVGLGSSNDFHKPYDGDLPLKVDASSPHRRDVVRASFDGKTRHFLVSASLGLTARGNAYFNTLGWIKRRWTGGAILWTATRTVATHRNLRGRVDGEEIDITNLSILKTPWLSGGFRFDTPVEDGLLTINLSYGRSKFGALKFLSDLDSGRFLGRPGTRHWRAQSLRVELPHPAPLELDGEVVEARDVHFEIAGQIGVCS